MKLRDLNPAEYNPRTITDEQLERLKKALHEFGDLSGIVFNHKTGNLVGGHQRLKCLPPAAVIKKEKLKKPARTGTVATGTITIDNEAYTYREVDWDETKEKAANIAANQHGGEFDDEKLSLLLKELSEAPDFDADLLGFDNSEFEQLLNLVTNDGLTDPDEIPEVTEGITKTGDLWLLGSHRLLCGDATKKEDVERLMNGEKADMVFTDPPYNYKQIKGAGIFKKQVLKLAKDIEHISTFNPSDFLKIVHICFPENIIVLFVFCNKDLIPEYLNWARIKGYSFNLLAWHKPNHLPLTGNAHHYPDTEYLIFIKKGGIFNSGLSPEFYRKYFILNNEKHEDHPTIKPVEIIEREIILCSHTNSLILDPFLGSGSTLIACEKTGRICYGMEIDPHYCDVIIKRWEDFTGKKAIKQ